MKYELLGKLSIKCVLVGDCECGKTSLAAQITNKEFKTEYIPTTFDNFAGKHFLTVLDNVLTYSSDALQTSTRYSTYG